MTVETFDRDAIKVALQNAHWIPRLRSSHIVRGGSVLRYLDLLRACGAVVVDRRHFTGLRVRKDLVAVDIHSDGTTVMHQLTRRGTRKITFHENRASGE
jgi:hypothetical protein